MPREDQTWTCTWRTWPKLFDFAALAPHNLKGVKFRWRRFSFSLLRSVRTYLSFWDHNSVIQQTVRSGIWRNWRRRKLHLAKTAYDNRSGLSPSLSFGRNSATNWIRHRATNNDFRHQEMDSLAVWSMQHAFMTLNNPSGAEIMTAVLKKLTMSR